MSKAKKGMYAGENNPMYGVHLKCSEEKKKKLSAMFKGKKRPECSHVPTEAERKAASIRFSGEGNPFYGKQHSEESKRKMREARKKSPVLCVETGCQYVSMNEATRATGIHSASISRACKTGLTAGGFHWKYIVQ